MSIGIGLQALGAGWQGGNPGQVVDQYRARLDSEQRKGQIASLMDRMGIAGPERGLLDTMPLQAQQQYLLGKMTPAAPDGVVIGDKLVDRVTGRVLGDYGPKPLNMAAVFGDPRAQYIRAGLIERGLPPHVADAFVVNFNDESGLNPAINEVAPLVPGSRGGFGLAQWTGPRRVQLEQFAKARGTAPDDIDTQLDFLVEELGGSEAAAGRGILATSDTAEAAQVIVNDFLRPAPEHAARRTANYANLDARIERITNVLASGQGTPAQREALEFERARLMDEQERQRGAGGPNVEEESKLRKEFMGLPSVKAFEEQKNAFGRIVASADNPSPAGDLALIFNYMKVLDPGSVVRESEFATAAKAGSYGERIAALVGQVEEGTRLSPAQRADFVKRAEALYDDARRQFEARREEYMGIAGDYGLNADRVAPDLTYRGNAVASSPRPGARPGQMQGPPLPQPAPQPAPLPSAPTAALPGPAMPYSEAQMAEAIGQLSPADLALFRRMKKASDRLDFLRRKGLIE